MSETIELAFAYFQLVLHRVIPKSHEVDVMIVWNTTSSLDTTKWTP